MLPLRVSFRAAITFLSRIPSGAGDGSEMAYALPWFPVAGLLVGAILGFAAAVELRFLPLLLGAFLFVPTYFLVKGILHTDGLADTMDALAAHGSPKERDEILRDPHIGVAGALAGAVFVVGLVALMASLPNGTGPLAPAAVLFPPLRIAPFVVPVVAEVAAATGIAATFAMAPLSPHSRLARALLPGATPPRLAAALATGGVLLALVGGLFGVGAFVASVGVAGVVAVVARRRFAGLSGDLLGAGHDLAFLLVLVLAAGVPWLR